MRILSLASIATVAVAALAYPGAASANFSVLLSNCNQSLGCTPATGNNFGTVSVTDDGANTVKITVTLSNPAYQFHQHSGSGLDSFAFNLAAGFTGTIVPASLQSGWSVATPPLNEDGMGSFALGLDLTVSGSGNSVPGPLVFDVSATGLSAIVADFATGGPAFNSLVGYFFVADVICDGTTTVCNSTGLVGGNQTVVINPLPAPIVGAGLPGIIAAAAGLWAFARRRRRSQA